MSRSIYYVATAGSYLGIVFFADQEEFKMEREETVIAFKEDKIASFRAGEVSVEQDDTELFWTLRDNDGGIVMTVGFDEIAHQRIIEENESGETASKFRYGSEKVADILALDGVSVAPGVGFGSS